MSTVTGLPPLHNTMGALFVGVISAMALWGVGCVQLYWYYNTYNKDDWMLKSLVLTVWSLDTVHQGLITHTIYTYLITEYANPLMLGVIVPTLIYEVLISAIICFLVQCFLVFRVWRLSHKSYLTVGTLMSFVLAELLLSIVYVAQAIPLQTYLELTQLVNLSRAVNIFAVVSDVAIAATLIFLLQRSRTGFRQSETIINRCILFTINTGAMTSLFAVMSLVTITVLPTTFVYILFYVNMSRLYSNTLFATLNARKTIRSGTTLGDESTLGNGHSLANSTNHLSLNKLAVKPVNVHVSSHGSVGGGTGMKGRGLEVKVEREVHHTPSRTLNNGSDSDVSGTYYGSAKGDLAPDSRV